MLWIKKQTKALLILLLASCLPLCCDAKPLLSAFFYEGKSTITPNLLNRYKKPIQHLDILIYSINAIRSHGDAFALDPSVANNLRTLATWLKNNVPHTRLMLSLGTWRSKKMYAAITNPTQRARFTRTLIAVLKNPAYGLSGVDIDWENIFYPHTHELTQFPLFLQALHRSFANNGLSNAYLSVDLPAPIKFAHIYPDPRQWINAVNWANLMGYDFYGPKLPYTELDAAMGHVTIPYPRKVHYAGTSFLSTLAVYHQRGIPNNKLVIALPFYSSANYIARADHSHHFGLHVPTLETHTMTSSYNHIYHQYGLIDHPTLSNVRHHSYTFSTPKGAAGMTGYWIIVRQTGLVNHFVRPYLFVSYPDPRALASMADYFIAHGYRGLSVWMLTDDLPYSHPKSLLKTLYNATH